VVLTTRVPDWFWRGIGRLRLRPGSAAPLPVEGEGGTDRRATAESLRAFCADAQALVKRERDFLAESGTGLVVSDIDPAPFAAAEGLGVPAYGVANFTWDWIYARLLPGMRREVEVLQRLYRSGIYLRLPLGPPEHPFLRSRDVGLLPGGVPRDTKAARRLLGGGKTLLVALRDPGRLAGPLPALRDWQAITALPRPRFPGARNLPPEELADAGVGFADLTAAADAILCKPGYGMISQILTLGLRAVVLRRTDFPETPYLTAPLEDRPGVVLADAAEVRRRLPAILAALRDTTPAPPTKGDGGIAKGDGGILTQMRY
jgi:L-arabinokinase